jgi:hypothetical protein
MYCIGSSTVTSIVVVVVIALLVVVVMGVVIIIIIIIKLVLKIKAHKQYVICLTLVLLHRCSFRS